MSFFKSITKGFSSAGGNFYNGVGSALNKLTGTEKQMSDSYKQQLKSMKLQNDYNTYMWNLANEYNSPVAQLARMAQAGIEINPTSYALGTGNLSNTASVVSSDNGFAGSGSPAGNPVSMAMGVATGLQGMKESSSRISNMAKQNENLDGVIDATKLENDIRRHNLRYAKEHNTPVGSTPGLESTVMGTIQDAITNGGWTATKKFLTPSWNSAKDTYSQAWNTYKDAYGKASSWVKSHLPWKR